MQELQESQGVQELQGPPHREHLQELQGPLRRGHLSFAVISCISRSVFVHSPQRQVIVEMA